MAQTESAQTVQRQERVALYRQRHAAADRWAAGYGPMQHTLETQDRVFTMAERLAAHGIQGDGVPLFELLYAADRLASAGMWLVVHQTYARQVYLDGRKLAGDDFKRHPDGHTGGSLNMVPAYMGYMAVNALTSQTRSWIMGQGHCVAAIDALNLLLDNMSPAHAERYALTEAGLARYVQDFYAYRLRSDGRQDSPLGSHVNAYTAGGLVEGGYLGFVELQYVHMPLPGERLIAFLSDGAFEEQRGSDWAPRWWRADDCGLVMPIMINNGRRIDQRTTLSQAGGLAWFVPYLTLHSFDPIVFDGRDPAAFTWAIFEMEQRLEAAAAAVRAGHERYPVRLPYGIAVAPKGAGFYNEGTNLAHNLPLLANPHTDAAAAEHFNTSARRLWVPLEELQEARGAFQHHTISGRPKERDHALAHRHVQLQALPAVSYRPIPADRRDASRWTRYSPMCAIDSGFLAVVQANPHLRPRVGNPDEMRSNRMQHTLDALHFRVTDPEESVPEAIDGAVITALNEEAVACAALANKGGINIIVTYEAFGDKMHGAMRQEILFAQHCNEAGRPQGWLSIPLVLTSHTWENGKNEQSHQDPSMAEAMLGETSQISRVLFPADYNTAAAVLQGVYQTQGQFWTLVVPKAEAVSDLFTPAEAERLLADGALLLQWAGYQHERARVVLTAVGAYQLEAVLTASRRLSARDIPHAVIYMLEPGRFRTPRNAGERAHAVPEALRTQFYPDNVPARVFVTHTRPEPLLGVLQPLHTGAQTVALGFVSQGGTLSTAGMLLVNRCTWAHIVAQVVRLLDLVNGDLLSPEEWAALAGQRSPEGILIT